MGHRKHLGRRPVRGWSSKETASGDPAFSRRLAKPAASMPKCMQMSGNAPHPAWSHFLLREQFYREGLQFSN